MYPTVFIVDGVSAILTPFVFVQVYRSLFDTDYHYDLLFVDHKISARVACHSHKHSIEDILGHNFQ